MILVTGGAYQGKTSWAAKEYDVKSIHDCENDVMPKYADCIIHMERFSRECVKRGIDSVKWLSDNREIWRDAVIVCRDIGSGVVPMERENRFWREENGRMLAFLAKESERTVRIFCGISEVLK